MKHFKKIVAVAMILALALGLMVIPASAARALAVGAATVNASSLNIRSGPDITFDRVKVVSKGTKLVVLEKTTEQWYMVNYKGIVGYVSAEYLDPIQTAENFDADGTVSDNAVRMRASHTTDSDILARYDAGTVLTIIGINDGWYKCKDGDITGYIRSDLMEITGGGVITTASSLGQDIANFALNYVGYRYVYGAESPSEGFDCSGLAYYVYGQYGYKLDRRASLQYANNGVKVAKSELQPGDLVFFSSSGTGVTHVGLFIGGTQFVHASTSTTGVIISDLTSAYYMRCWWGAKRII